MMQEEIIPPLKAALEAEEDVSQVQLAYQNNTVSDGDDYLGPVWICFQLMAHFFHQAYQYAYRKQEHKVQC
jgi:hypothetical protein